MVALALSCASLRVEGPSPSIRLRVDAHELHRIDPRLFGQFLWPAPRKLIQVE